MTDNVVIVLVIMLVVGLASLYIYKAKKKGAKCIGCPDSKSCNGSCSGCNSCNATEE